MQRWWRRLPPSSRNDNPVATGPLSSNIARRLCSSPGWEAGHLESAADFVAMLVALPEKKRHRRADSPFCRFGRVLAAIALLLQIATPFLHPAGSLRLTDAAGDFSAAFDEHALCRRAPL